jgi:hypothetical protein
MSEFFQDAPKLGNQYDGDSLLRSYLKRKVPYDAWGNCIDHIEVSEAWKQFDRISAEEGLVALAHVELLGKDEMGFSQVTEAQARKFAWELAEIYGEVLILEHHE